MGHSENKIMLNAEHDELFALVDKLQNSNKKVISKQENLNILGRLIRRCHLHFIAEEKLFTLSQLPKAHLDDHKTKHRELIRFLDRSFLLYQSGQIKTLQELNIYLNEWFTNHINHYDEVLHKQIKALKSR